MFVKVALLLTAIATNIPLVLNLIYLPHTLRNFIFQGYITDNTFRIYSCTSWITSLAGELQNNLLGCDYIVIINMYTAQPKLQYF